MVEPLRPERLAEHSVTARIMKEGPISLLQAANEKLPLTSSGKPIHVTALHKWANPNRSGPVLETIKIGNRIYTSRQAVDRFIEASNEERSRTRATRGPKSRSAARIEREADKAGKALEKLGI